jgi:hypothetical protein
MRFIGVLELQGRVQPPTAPTNASASEDGIGQVSVTWTDNSSGVEQEDLFRVQGQLNGTGGAWTELGTVLTDVTTYNDLPSTSMGAVNGDTAYYRVRAENAAGNSVWSSPSTGIVLANQPL